MTALATPIARPPTTRTTDRGQVNIREASLTWAAADRCPPEWPAYLRQFGGGFFHSSAGLAQTPGTPCYATLLRGGTVVGIAAGVWQRCRLSLRARHFYSPSLPALGDSAASVGDEALAAWREFLQRAGAVEAVVDSFDASWKPGAPQSGDAPERLEYLVPILAGEAQTARCADTHRRHVRRGERDGWHLAVLEGSEAARALDLVRATAAERAAGRGDAFAVAPIDALATARDGIATFAATASDGALLAAALVGWANQRAFYVMGGSSPDGYKRSAAVWLHWRIMQHLGAAGCAVYNLGGTPPGAEADGSPAHGLYRFKTGFGADVVSRRGAHWIYRSTHVAAHVLIHRLAAALRPRKTAAAGDT